MDLFVYFNYRSPYCYLASKHMFDLFDAYDVTIQWRALGGWNGRSDPERAKKKVPLTRQDVSRWARRMNIAFVPPPIHTDPTRAGAGSFLAQQAGLLKAYTIAVMEAEWGEGKDIGDLDVLRSIAEQIGLDADALCTAVDDPQNQQKLTDHWQDAETRGVIGVPSFVIGDQIFWGQDRMSFLAEHLDDLGLRRPGKTYKPLTEG